MWGVKQVISKMITHGLFEGKKLPILRLMRLYEARKGDQNLGIQV